MFADEFRSRPGGESVAQHQRQYLDSLATAMEQMTAAIRKWPATPTTPHCRPANPAKRRCMGPPASIAPSKPAIQGLADEISQASSAVEHLTLRAPGGRHERLNRPRQEPCTGIP